MTYAEMILDNFLCLLVTRLCKEVRETGMMREGAVRADFRSVDYLLACLLAYLLTYLLTCLFLSVEKKKDSKGKKGLKKEKKNKGKERIEKEKRRK